MKAVLFSSKTCSVCKTLKPKLKEIMERYKVPFRELVIEENRAEAAQRMVFSAPTLIILENDRELRRWSRVFSVSEVEEFLTRIL